MYRTGGPFGKLIVQRVDSLKRLAVDNVRAYVVFDTLVRFPPADNDPNIRAVVGSINLLVYIIKCLTSKEL